MASFQVSEIRSRTVEDTQCPVSAFAKAYVDTHPHTYMYTKHTHTRERLTQTQRQRQRGNFFKETVLMFATRWRAQSQGTLTSSCIQSWLGPNSVINRPARSEQGSELQELKDECPHGFQALVPHKSTSDFLTLFQINLDEFSQKT